MDLGFSYILYPKNIKQKIHVVKVITNIYKIIKILLR
jgi:hypothetical protein